MISLLGPITRPAYMFACLPAASGTLLAEHNSYRALHQHTPPMTYDTTIQASAQAWSDQCMWKHSGTAGVGENIAASGGMAYAQALSSAIDGW